jgi:hypothetical protein
VPFARCPAAKIEVCDEIEPSLDELWPGHRAACHLALQRLPLKIKTASGEPVEQRVPRRKKHMMGLRIASDIGGTFTDLVYLDEQTGEVKTTKASTTPHAQGVLDTRTRRLDWT